MAVSQLRSIRNWERQSVSLNVSNRVILAVEARIGAFARLHAVSMTVSASSNPSSRRRIAVAGAGVIGLSCAFELARRGHSVTCFDGGDVRRTTSWAAAGMIAPAYEMFLHGEETGSALNELSFESARLWESFAPAVRQVSGMPVGYSNAPTLAVAQSSEQRAGLRALQAALREIGHTAYWIDRERAISRLGLSARVDAVLELTSDHQVDNRRLLTALRTGLRNLGGAVVSHHIGSLEDASRLGGSAPFDAIIWARGCHERGVTRHVKGQALALHPVEGMPAEVVRFGSGYIVPKPDRIIIGATSEATYSHPGVDAAAIEALFRSACNIVPGLRTARRLESWSGLRPGSVDAAPIIGQHSDREFVATAHYRNGILLAPATAQRIADMVEGKPSSPRAESFSPDRPAIATV